VKITWNKLNTANNAFDLLPPTVFYGTRVSTGTGANPVNAIWSSSCVLGDLLCGPNPPEFTIGATLVKGEWYSDGLELSDSSALGTTDLVIGMKNHDFKIATS